MPPVVLIGKGIVLFCFAVFCSSAEAGGVRFRVASFLQIVLLLCVHGTHALRGTHVQYQYSNIENMRILTFYIFFYKGGGCASCGCACGMSGIRYQGTHSIPGNTFYTREHFCVRKGRRGASRVNLKAAVVPA